MTPTVKQIVDECGDVARERWRFYYERGLNNATVTAATADADTSLIAEYERSVLVPSRQVAAVRTVCGIAQGVFMHTTNDGEIDRGIMAQFVAGFAKVKKDLP